MMAIFEIINATDSLIQHIIRIVWLSLIIIDLSWIFQPKNSRDHAEFRALIYQNQTSFPHTLSLKRGG